VDGLTSLLEIISRPIFTSIPTWRLFAHHRWTSISQMVMMCVLPCNFERGSCQYTWLSDLTCKDSSSVLDCHSKYQKAFWLEDWIGWAANDVGYPSYFWFIYDSNETIVFPLCNEVLNYCTSIAGQKRFCWFPPRLHLKVRRSQEIENCKDDLGTLNDNLQRQSIWIKQGRN
jgi:hypothetical protein